MEKMLSPTAMSNLYTMGVAGTKDPRQKIPARYEIPSEETRILRARLIMEEALETIKGLGIVVALGKSVGGSLITMEEICFDGSKTPPNIEEIIDGCCDLIYVAVGTLCAAGVPDLPHLAEVCRANDAKFPNGVAVTDENGKFQKPVTWEGPDHDAVAKGLYFNMEMAKRAMVEVRGATPQLRG